MIDFNKGYLVEEINDGLYWVTEGVYQAIFLVADEGVILVDAPPSIGANLLAAIEEVTDNPVTHLVYSHSHRDHIGAAGLIVAAYPTVKIIAQKETAQELREAHGFNPNDGRPLPSKVFNSKKLLRVGNQVLQLKYEGAVHVPGNIFIYAPNQKVLMLVDVIFPGWVPFANLALAKNTRKFIQAHDLALAFDFDVFVGGHLTRLGNRADVEEARTYVLDVMNRAGVALGSVDFFSIFLQFGPNTFNVFDKFLDAVAQHCADHVEPSWQHLGGVDVFTKSHCFTMQNFLRLE